MEKLSFDRLIYSYCELSQIKRPSKRMKAAIAKLEHHIVTNIEGMMFAKDMWEKLGDPS